MDIRRVVIIFLACAGKFGGSTIAARLTGLSWRESSALGILMNTRGLMELVVLNIGLDLEVMSPTVFTIMVIMSLVTTLMTRDAAGVLLLYLWLLGGLSFLYGVFHAAGPGHGKVVISSYVLANETQLRRGVTLSVLSALLQSVVAVVFVLIAEPRTVGYGDPASASFYVADALRLKGLAEAEAMAAKAKSWGDYNEAASNTTAYANGDGNYAERDGPSATSTT